MNHPDEEKRKIIIDEDWKSQVEAERARLKTAPADTAGSEAPEGDTFTGRLPEPSFDLLVSTLATQALACLGQIPDPFENKPVVRLELAKHHVDMLAVLEQKTKGESDVAVAAASILARERFVDWMGKAGEEWGVTSPWAPDPPF